MLKKLLPILLLLAPVVVFAATNNFVANGNITVSSVTFGSGTADMLIFNGSTAASWAFSSGTFTVTNPGSAFQVGSSDSTVKSIQVSQNGTTLACSENTTPGTSAVTLPTTAGTYTVSPSATTQCTSLCTALSNVASYNSFPTCGAASCNTGYTLSGSGASATCTAVGGGGWTPQPPAPPGNGFTVTSTLIKNSPGKIVLHFGFGSDVTKIVISNNTAFDPATYIDATPVLEWTISRTGTWYVKYCNKYASCSNPVSVSTPLESTSAVAKQPITSNFLFGTTLQMGMQNDNVRKLQELLASDKTLYPEGLVTSYYGSLTQKAVERFQVKYNIVSSGTPETTGYGLVGPKTRAKLAEVFSGGVSTTTTPAIPVEATNALFSVNLGFGMQSSDVYRLQQLLAMDSNIYPEGIVSGYFGPKTLEAVKRFQIKYGIVSSDSEAGYGSVGPKTRAKLQEIFK